MKTLIMAVVLLTGLKAGDTMCIMAMQDTTKESDYTRLYYKAGDMFNARVHASLTRSAVISFRVECRNSTLTKRQYANGVKAGKEVVQHLRDLGLLR